MTGRARAWALHGLRLVVGLALLAAVLKIGGVEELDKLGAVAPVPIALAMLATIVVNVAAALRWGRFADSLGGRRVARAFDYVYYTVVARVFGYLLPRDLAEVGSRTLALRRHDLPLSRGIASALLDRVFDVILLGAALVAALPFWFGWLDQTAALWLLALVPLAFGVLFGAFWRPLLAAPISAMNFAMRMSYAIRRRSDQQPPPLATDELSRRDVVMAYGLGWVKFAATALRMTAFAWALDLPIDPALLLLATPIGQVGYALAFTPGGLGIFDGGWLAILVAGGVPSGDAAALVVGMRVLTLVMLVALVGVAYLLRSAFLANRSGRTENTA